MSYAVFEQGIITTKRFVPGDIIASSDTEADAAAYAYDWAVEQAFTRGFDGYNQARIDDWYNKVSIIKLNDKEQ